MRSIGAETIAGCYIEYVTDGEAYRYMRRLPDGTWSRSMWYPNLPACRAPARKNAEKVARRAAQAK